MLQHNEQKKPIRNLVLSWKRNPKGSKTYREAMNAQQSILDIAPQLQVILERPSLIGDNCQIMLRWFGFAGRGLVRKEALHALVP